MVVSWHVFCIFLPLLYSKTQKGITRGHCWTCVVERTENCEGRNPSPEKCLFCSSFYCNPRKPEFPSYPWLALSLPAPCCSLLPCAVHASLGSWAWLCQSSQQCMARDTNPPGDTGSHMLVKKLCLSAMFLIKQIKQCFTLTIWVSQILIWKLSERLMCI